MWPDLLLWSQAKRRQTKLDVTWPSINRDIPVALFGVGQGKPEGVTIPIYINNMKK